jgi:nucleoid-associated protein YgaU
MSSRQQDGLDHRPSAVLQENPVDGKMHFRLHAGAVYENIPRIKNPSDQLAALVSQNQSIQFQNLRSDEVGVEHFLIALKSRFRGNPRRSVEIIQSAKPLKQQTLGD